MAALLLVGLSAQAQTLAMKSNGTTYLVDVHDVTQITFPKEEGVRKMDVQFTDDTSWKQPTADVQIVSPDEKTPVPGDPVTIGTTDNMADVLTNYMSNPEMAEGQVFYLKGGETYTLATTVNIYKGLTLQTDPADLAQGKRAKVNVSSTNYTPFMLGRAPVAGENEKLRLNIGAIRFVGIDFDCPDAKNYGDGATAATSNYFMNMYSNGLGFDLSLIEWSDCSFQGIIRGFFRAQGKNEKNIYSIRVMGCDFYNCGYYTSNGGDYGYFFMDHMSMAKGNLCHNVYISDNVFYNNPKRALISDSNRDITWAEDVRWNIDIHHNTFVNFNCNANNDANSIIYLTTIPAGSTIGFHDNVYILTKDAADSGRNLTTRGWYTNRVQGGDGTGRCTFNIYNNWTTNDADVWQNGKLFANRAIEATSNAPGALYNSWGEDAAKYFPYGKDELAVKVDNLKAIELMVSPNPKYMMGTTVTHNDWHTDTGITGLYYQQTDAVKASGIYKSGAGAQHLR